jgi:hypothetical protein
MIRRLQRGALALALALTTTTCVTEAPQTATAPPAAGSSDLLGGVVSLLPTLVRCDPLPHASAASTIGAEGGEIRVGPHRLVVPAGALASPTLITAEAPASSEVVVNFSPDGLQFAAPATLTLSYAHCNRPLSLNERIVQVDGLLGILALLPSLDLPSGEVSASLRHFSGYAVAW